jgi:hypothetical protein
MVWRQRIVLADATPSDEDLNFEVRVFSADVRSSTEPRADSSTIIDHRCLCAAARQRRSNRTPEVQP